MFEIAAVGKKFNYFLFNFVYIFISFWYADIKNKLKKYFF